MRAYLDSECGRCYGFGMVLPKVNPLAEDTELDLCPKCHGTGRIPKAMQTQGFYGLVAGMALSEGWAYRTRRECEEFIERNYA